MWQQLLINGYNDDVEVMMFIVVVKHRSFSFGEGKEG